MTLRRRWPVVPVVPTVFGLRGTLADRHGPHLGNVLQRNLRRLLVRGDAFTFRAEEDALEFVERVICSIVVNAELLELRA